MSITLDKALLCRNLHGLEEKQDMRRQNELRDLTCSAVREKEPRQQGSERVMMGGSHGRVG